MKKKLVLTLTIMTTLSLATAFFALAGEKTPPAPAPAHPKMDMQGTTEGKPILAEVTKVDGKAKTIQARTKEGDKTFDVSGAKLAGYESLSQMKPGDRIAVLYEEKDGKPKAKLIMNHSAMKMPAPASK